jgi:hypothetical protein
MKKQQTAHRPSQSGLQYVKNSHGKRVLNTAYVGGATQAARWQGVVAGEHHSADSRLLHNSEAAAWYLHAKTQDYVATIDDYESDDDYDTPQERAVAAIAMSGVTRAAPGSSYAGELPALNPYDDEYVSGTGFKTLNSRSDSRTHWLIDRSQEWLGRLDEEELQAVVKWTRDGHELIGDYLGTGRIGYGETAESIDEFQRVLHRALDKPGARLNEPIHIYRGINSSRLASGAPKDDLTSPEAFASYLERGFVGHALSNDDMPRSATLSAAVAAHSFTSGPIDVVLDIETDEIQSPSNLNVYGTQEEEVLVVGSIIMERAEVRDGIVVVHCSVN